MVRFNWKTTLGAIITIATTVLELFGIEVPADVKAAMMTIGVFIIGLFAKDHDK